MDQKNIIVKCAKHKCLFNNCGTCDQYVITIGVDNTCQAYIETEGFTFKEQKTCHPDCIHFNDSDPMVGPMCLFKHPEPLKEFYDGMPCDYYHQRKYATKEEEQIYNKTKKMLESQEVTFISSTCGDCEYFQDNGLLQCPCDKHEQYAYRKAPACDDFKAKRGQRARGNFFEDKMNIDDKHLGEMVTLQMKIAELNKPNKNKSVLKSDHLCDIRCVSAHYAEDGELYCALIQDFPERPLTCSAYDDGGDE